MYRVTCSVHVDCGNGHMVGWAGQLIATRTGVESSFGAWESDVQKG